MARLARLATTAGGTALATLVPLLLLVIGGLILIGLLVLVWILSDDRRAERLNLLLRGARLPRPASAEPASAEAASQTMDYAGYLRKAGRPDLAELVEQASQQPGSAEHESAVTRPQR